MDAADNAKAMTTLMQVGTLNDQGEVIPDPVDGANALIK
jgi:hypothetical protein